MRCQQCGKEYEGFFCPACGTPNAPEQGMRPNQVHSRESEAFSRCPVCNTLYAGKFCPQGCQNPGVVMEQKKGGLKGWQIALLVLLPVLAVCLLAVGILAFNINGIIAGEDTLRPHEQYLYGETDSIPFTPGYCLKTILPNQTITQNDCSIRVDKVEFYNNKTKVYVTIENHSSHPFLFLDSLSEVRQEGKTYSSVQNDPIDASPQLWLDPGSSTSGVISFEVVDFEQDFTVALSGNSAANSDYDRYVFDLKPDTGPESQPFSLS